MSKQRLTCGDCYFKKHGLCALALEQPCPTFRADTLTLQPPHQAQLVARAPLAVVAAPAAYAV
jgi:hypothetical protein